MDITVQELKQKLDNKEEFVFIDVREPHEYAEYNIGAKLIPLGDISNQMDEFEDYKNSEIIVHCRSGARSAVAQELFRRAGFSNVRNLTGGVLQWVEAFEK